MNKLFLLLLVCLPMACIAGTNPVLQNPATTNNTVALIAFVQQYASAGVGATNITAGGVLTGNSGTTATIPAGFSTAGSNFIAAVANTATNGLVTLALLNTASNQNAAATIATNGLLITYINVASNQNAAANIASNALALAYANTGSNQVASSLVATNALLISDINTASNQNSAAIIATNTALISDINTTSNALALTATGNSFTTNFSLTAWPTNITIYLPSSSTNYLVQEELFIVSKSTNPHGAILPSGTAVASKYISSGPSANLITIPPLSESPNGNNYIFIYDGDYVALNDQAAVYNTFNAAYFTSSFSVTARYIWTIHK